MALRLEVTSEHRTMLGDDHVRSFGPDGGTIGRSLKNDWVLPDTERFISGRHATIDYQAGSFYLADISTNGVYVNGELEPLGKGNPRRLFDGDRVRMGNFEMRVHLDEGEDLELPPESGPSVVPDHIEQLVPVDDSASSMLLLDEDEIRGENAFAVLGSGAESEPVIENEPEPELPVRIPAPVDEEQRPDAATHSRPSAESDQAAALLETFLKAAGIDPDDLHPSIDPAQVLENAGSLLNEFVVGICELLTARTNVKGMFRLDQTTVLPRHNNPLKLSAGAVDSLRQLLVGREGEYLGGLDSIREACRDLRYHHDALVAAMIRAFDDYLGRFDPDELEGSFQQTMNRKPLFDVLARHKYWELYRDLFPVMAEKSTSSLPVQYTEDFVRYYESQLNDFRRREIALGDTQKLDRSGAIELKSAAPDDASLDGDPAHEPTKCIRVLPLPGQTKRQTG